MSEGETRQVPVDDLEILASQSRETFDEPSLVNLSNDIKLNGQLQPGVAWLDEGRNQLILVCGERRLRAIRRAGLPTMEVKLIRGKLTLAQLLAMNIAENVQRESLNPIERGNAFRRMMKLEGISAREVAIRLHLSDATICRDLSLADLSPDLQARVASGDLPASVAASIVRLNDVEARRLLADQYASGAVGRDGVAREVSTRLGATRLSKPKPIRLSFKLDGGIAVTMSVNKPPTAKILNGLCDHLKREAKKLEGIAQAVPLEAS